MFWAIIARTDRTMKAPPFSLLSYIFYEPGAVIGSGLAILSGIRGVDYHDKSYLMRH